MANHKSAKKRIRQTVVRRLRNRGHMSALRTSVKEFDVALGDLQKGKGDAEAVKKLLCKAQSSLAHGVKLGLLHKNTAARKTSRLAAQMKKVTA